MLKGATARRYAEAVFELGAENNTIDRWLQDLRLIAEYFSDRRLVFLLGEPNIQFNRKEQIVKDLLEGKVQHEALNLALLLVERGLVELMPRVREEFERKYDEYHHQIHATLTTAMPLDDLTRASVLADLEHLTGKKVLLKEQIDPSILGGALARVGDTLIDGSVRRRLQLLRQQMERGGSFTSEMEGVHISANGSGPGAAETPFIVRPPEPGAPANGGPATATETAPRHGHSPHMAPRPSGPPEAPGQASTNPMNTSSKNRNTSRKRGRRR
ncbi:MAG TPA: ATP synthase F1 subunit delta [Ktedonobacterales bacterium]